MIEGERGNKDGRFSGFISEWIVTAQDEMVNVSQFTVAGDKAWRGKVIWSWSPTLLLYSFKFKQMPKLGSYLGGKYILILGSVLGTQYRYCISSWHLYHPLMQQIMNFLGVIGHRAVTEQWSLSCWWWGRWATKCCNPPWDGCRGEALSMWGAKKVFSMKIFPSCKWILKTE